jgi:LPXTG-motif cell wall-anchored protein
VPRTRLSEPARRRLLSAIAVGWLAFLASSVVGLVDGPDDLRDALMVAGLVALVVALAIFLGRRRR